MAPLAVIGFGPACGGTANPRCRCTRDSADGAAKGNRPCLECLPDFDCREGSRVCAGEFGLCEGPGKSERLYRPSPALLADQPGAPVYGCGGCTHAFAAHAEGGRIACPGQERR